MPRTCLFKRNSSTPLESDQNVLFTSGSQVPGIVAGTQKLLSKCLFNGSANTTKTWKMGSWTFQGQLCYRERRGLEKEKKKHGDIMFNFVFLPPLNLFSSTY